MSSTNGMDIESSNDTAGEGSINSSEQTQKKQRTDADFRVAVMGQGAFGAEVLKELIALDEVQVVGASAPEPKEGGNADPLWAAASEAGLPCVDTRSLKKEEGMAAWKELDLDLCVMAFVTVIIPDEALQYPRQGTIQYHPSLLPLHRGASAIGWSILLQEKQTGYTVFWPDHGLDTGPILLQETVDIGADDTTASLYFSQLFPMGVKGMVKATLQVRDGTAERVEQDHSVSTYEPILRKAQAKIEWYQPADRVYALIRACNSQPGAWTPYGGEDGVLKIFTCKLLEQQVDGMYGTVLDINTDPQEGYFDVRLNGGTLRVQKVQVPGSKKVNAGAWAGEEGLEVGFRFK